MPLDDYAPLVGLDTVERIRRKGAALRDRRAVHVNGTYLGGGVAEMLASLVPLFVETGLPTEWRILRGHGEFFDVTKGIHNALQGDQTPQTDAQFAVYLDVVAENAQWNHLDHDFVVIHDPQPLPLIVHYARTGCWFWRCHIDLSVPNDRCWQVLRPFVESYDAVIATLEDYQQTRAVPHHYFMPAIDPFSDKNRPMDADEVARRLQEADIPTDLPLVAQVSRFDPWKDPQGVIEAARLAREQVDCRLLLLGNLASDDPEGQGIFDGLVHHQDDHILIRCGDDPLLVNALQRAASVIIQKSLREGFGLTVTEALWKGTPVIGGDVGGIRHQIVDGENGYLVSSVEQCAQRIVDLVRDDEGRRVMGERGREVVARKFLVTRLLEQYLDLFTASNGTPG